jgi:hypothetical protein
MSLSPDLLHDTVHVVLQELPTIFLGISILKQLIHQSGDDLS